MGSRTYIALLGAAAVVILLQSWSLSSHVHHLNKPERPEYPIGPGFKTFCC